MKRLRGIRRYLWCIHRSASSLQIDVAPGSWYDLWHYHASLGGSRGHIRPRPSFKRDFRRAIVTAFERILAQAAHLEQPFQAWLLLDENDFNQDAAYLHAPPAGSKSPFPIRLEGARWDVSPPEELADLLPVKRFRFAEIYEEGNRVLYVEPRGVGLPLQQPPDEVAGASSPSP